MLLKRSRHECARPGRGAEGAFEGRLEGNSASWLSEYRYENRGGRIGVEEHEGGGWCEFRALSMCLTAMEMASECLCIDKIAHTVTAPVLYGG
jgi:hypothetical protein